MLKLLLPEKLKLFYGRAFQAKTNGEKCLAYEIIPSEALQDDLEIEVNLVSPNLRQYLEMVPSQNGSEKDYLLFQMVEGEVLGQIMLKKQLLSENQLVTILRSILNGLLLLHHNKTLGRCFCTDSIKTKPSGESTLMEFGFAPNLLSNDNRSFMPPEVESKYVVIRCSCLGVDTYEGKQQIIQSQLKQFSSFKNSQLVEYIKSLNDIKIDQRLYQVYPKELLNNIQLMLVNDPNKRLKFEDLYSSKIFQNDEALDFYQSEMKQLTLEINSRQQRREFGVTPNGLLNQTIQIPYHLLRHSQLRIRETTNISSNQIQVEDNQFAQEPRQFYQKQEHQIQQKQQHQNYEKPPLPQKVQHDQQGQLHQNYQQQQQREKVQQQDDEDFLPPSNSQIMDSIKRLGSRMGEALSRESVNVQQQSIFDYNPGRQGSQTLKESPTFDMVHSKPKEKTLQPPSLDQRQSSSSQHAQDQSSITDTKRSLFVDAKVNVMRILDIELVYEGEFIQITKLLELELYRIAFLKRAVNEIHLYIDNPTLLDVSKYLFQKARLIYIQVLVKKLKGNLFNLPTKDWINYTAQSQNHLVVQQKLSNIFNQEQQLLISLYDQAQKHKENLQLNPNLQDVNLTITKVLCQYQISNKEIQPNDTFDQSLKTPYRKIISIVFKELLKRLESTEKEVRLFPFAMKIVCLHLINRAFDPVLMITHFAPIAKKFSVLDPTTIESYLMQATPKEFIEQINLLMVSYFQ